MQKTDDEQRKECASRSYDAMTVYTAIVFARYMMLALENRIQRDERAFCSSKNSVRKLQEKIRQIITRGKMKSNLEEVITELNVVLKG